MVATKQKRKSTRKSQAPTQAEIDQLWQNATDPVWFVQNILGEERIYPKQEEILRSVQAYIQVSVVGASSSGKDWANSWARESAQNVFGGTTGGTRSAAAVSASHLNRHD